MVECLSASTEWRDRGPKRELYRRWRVPEYWIVDRWKRAVTVVRPDEDDRDVTDTITWHPAGAPEPLVIDLKAMFAEALDG